MLFQHKRQLVAASNWQFFYNSIVLVTITTTVLRGPPKSLYCAYKIYCL